MDGYELIRDSETVRVYLKWGFFDKLTFFFNKNLKSVDIKYERFVKKEEFTFIPQREERLTCECGHWQAETPCLSVKDIEFLHTTCKRMWGKEA